MAMAVTLIQAAKLTISQMRIKQVAVVAPFLPTAIGTFITAASAIFPDTVPNNRPVGNWLIPLAALQNQMPTLAQNAGRSYVGMNQASEIVYKMCWAGSVAEDTQLITTAQETALLAAWNTAFGT